MCHMSYVTCQMSYDMYHVSHVTCRHDTLKKMRIYFFYDIGVELVGGGSVITGATMFSLQNASKIDRTKSVKK